MNVASDNVRGDAEPRRHITSVVATAGAERCPRAPYGLPQASWSIDREPAAVPGLRVNVAGVLRAWGLDPDGDQTFAVVLVLTELVTNAARYGRPRLGLIEVDMWLDGDRVAVTVTDSSTATPVMREADAGDESGRGLQLITAYAEANGYELHRTGKRVWAVISPRPAPEAGAALLDAAQIAV
ncbi:ATP-binding protein [Kitasatospora sp. NPDC097605]|uniref:ATP-binding protein n=1 Tax=Kitasatospora sp. NPDC097605 TaxID=3157226 RepID=UPI00332C9F0F